MTSEQPEGLNLEPHPLVRQLHPDPDDAQDLISLVGYLGPSKQSDHVRLYSDLSFRHYYEIPSDGIVATRSTDADDPNSPTIVHVKASTRIDVVSVASQSVEAGFLRGAITSGYLGGTAGGAAQATVTVPTATLSAITLCGACPTHHPQQCPSHTICTVCTQFPPCPGRHGVGAAQVESPTTTAQVCNLTIFCAGGAGARQGQAAGALGFTNGCTNHCPTVQCFTVTCQLGGVQGQAAGTLPTAATLCTQPPMCPRPTAGHGCVGPTTYCIHAAQGQAAGTLPLTLGFGCTWACTQGCTFTPVCHQGGAAQGQAAQLGAAHPTGMPGCTWVCTQGCTFTPVCHQGGAGQRQAAGAIPTLECTWLTPCPTFAPHCPPGGGGQAQAAIGNPATFECTWNLPHCPPGGGVPHSQLGCTWVCTQGCTFTPVCPTIQCP